MGNGREYCTQNKYLLFLQIETEKFIKHARAVLAERR